MSQVKSILKGRNILVIDANATLRAQLKKLFEDEGAVVYSTGYIRTAKTLVTNLHKDSSLGLIICDPRLAHCYGLSAIYDLYHIQGENPLPTIVASSGFTTTAFDKMRLFGVVAYVQKPVFVDQLFKFCLTILESREVTTNELPIAA